MRDTRSGVPQTAPPPPPKGLLFWLITPVGRRRHTQTQGFRTSCAMTGLAEKSLNMKCRKKNSSIRQLKNMEAQGKEATERSYDSLAGTGQKVGVAVPTQYAWALPDQGQQTS